MQIIVVYDPMLDDDSYEEITIPELSAFFMKNNIVPQLGWGITQAEVTIGGRREMLVDLVISDIQIDYEEDCMYVICSSTEYDEDDEE
jgi:hypothetical protein